jgi:hypothetical protein
MAVKARRLVEELSFNDLFRVSDPRRVVRSLTVHGPPLEIDAYRNSMYYGFNFKSHPSTTGLRHRGYIKFHRPDRNMPLADVPCEVDCACPDYRYRWAWTNKQRGSGRLGINSLNQALNRAPRITNPGGRPGLCKHILAVKDYLVGQMSDRDFIGNEPEGDAATMLNKLVKRSQKIWINYPDTMQKARERNRQLAAARLARNRGEPPPDVPPDEDDTGPDGNMPPVPPVPPVDDIEEPEHFDSPEESTITMQDLQRPARPATPTAPPRPPRVESVDTSERHNMKKDLERSLVVIEELANDDISSSGFEDSVTGGCEEQEKSPGEQVISYLSDIAASLKALVDNSIPDEDMDLENDDEGDEGDEGADDIPDMNEPDLDAAPEVAPEEDNKLRGG